MFWWRITRHSWEWWYIKGVYNYNAKLSLHVQIHLQAKQSTHLIKLRFRKHFLNANWWNCFLFLLKYKFKLKWVRCFVTIVSPALNPQPRGPVQGITLCLVSTLWPVWHGWPYQKCKTPADVALVVIETSKLHHHNKVVIQFEADAPASVKRFILFFKLYQTVWAYLCFWSWSDWEYWSDETLSVKCQSKEQHNSPCWCSNDTTWSYSLICNYFSF